MARSRRTTPPPPPPPQLPSLPPLKLVAERLTTLERSDGQILEEDVIDDATDPNSPCHPFFTWDDTEAAHKQRLSEARLLIRRVRFTVTVHRIDLSAHKYVKDIRNMRGYRHVEMVKREESVARETLLYEMQRIVAAVKRAKITAVALDLSDEIQRLDELATGICRRITINDEPVASA